MRHSQLFTDDCRLAPYWWDDVSRPVLPSITPPANADVVIIGSGYTGLAAALQTARGGRSTVVLDAQGAGWGCSTRNGGQISTSIKPDYETLTRRFGAPRAASVVREGHNSLAWIGTFVAEEAIDCDFRIVGRFHAAHSPGRYEALARQIAGQPKYLRVLAHMVPRAEQHQELGTDAYYGGAVYEQHASVHPARLHQGMLHHVRAAGASIIPFCAATALHRDGGGFRIAYAGGSIAARNVIVATNGYTGHLVPWLQRRVIPIGSYIIATEPLSASMMARLMPRDRVVSDTRRVVYYYRASPDRRRILFGGRVALRETDPRVSGPRLYADMLRIFPAMSGTRISHSWAGFVAYTFDAMMHVGVRDGLYYALGYCGSGVGMAGYLGIRIGQQVLGRAEGATAFDNLPFSTWPFYRGNPWFLAPSIACYRMRDRWTAQPRSYRTATELRRLPVQISPASACFKWTPQPPAAMASVSRLASSKVRSACCPQSAMPAAVRLPAQCTRYCRLLLLRRRCSITMLPPFACRVATSSLQVPASWRIAMMVVCESTGM